jgi:chemotaxis regulatin CheY-phosphate phosphatase CheZ
MPHRAGTPTRRRPTPVAFGERRRTTQSFATEIAMLANALRELTAIRSTAEEAASRILTSTEGLLSSGDGASMKAEDAAMSIMTACGFHDLIGQRTAKVAEAIDKIIAARFARMDRAGKKAAADRQRRKTKLMLSGPDLPVQSTDQARIDALFARP